MSLDVTREKFRRFNFRTKIAGHSNHHENSNYAITFLSQTMGESRDTQMKNRLERLCHKKQSGSPAKRRKPLAAILAYVHHFKMNMQRSSHSQHSFEEQNPEETRMMEIESDRCDIDVEYEHSTISRSQRIPRAPPHSSIAIL